MEGKAKLGAIVGDALIGMHDLLELDLVALMAGLSFADVFEREAAELLETVGVFLLHGTAALEEAGEVLGVLATEPGSAMERRRTRALAMLAFKRLSSVLTPISECRTSCTCCWERGSCASFGRAWSSDCGASAGADASTGDVGAAASLLGWPWWPLALALAWKSELKSGLKLSVLSTGGSVGGTAAMLNCESGDLCCCAMLPSSRADEVDGRTGHGVFIIHGCADCSFHSGVFALCVLPPHHISTQSRT